jgi:hypothetical protein
VTSGRERYAPIDPRNGATMLVPWTNNNDGPHLASFPISHRTRPWSSARSTLILNRCHSNNAICSVCSLARHPAVPQINGAVGPTSLPLSGERRPSSPNVPVARRSSVGAARQPAMTSDRSRCAGTTSTCRYFLKSAMCSRMSNSPCHPRDHAAKCGGRSCPAPRGANHPRRRQLLRVARPPFPSLGRAPGVLARILCSSVGFLSAEGRRPDLVRPSSRSSSTALVPGGTSQAPGRR